MDDFLRTSDPAVYAAGDVAQHPNGQSTHLWHAAELQGQIAGRNVCGRDMKHDNPPFRTRCEVWGHYFFSINQCEARHAETAVERESGEMYQSFYFDEDRCLGALMIDDKPRAELYVQSVTEGWPRSRVERDLAF